MARPRSRSTDSTDSTTPALFPVESAPRPRRGRHERAVERAVAAARKAGGLEDEHAALVSLLRALGRALDHAETTSQPYAVAQVGRELRAALQDARLVPTAAAVVDPFTALLDDLDESDREPARS